MPSRSLIHLLLGLGESSLQSTLRGLLLVQLLLSAVNSWTYGSVFDADLYVISKNSNSFVGLAESIKGLTGLLAALPLGYLADVMPRRLLLRAFAILGIPVGIVVAIGLLYQSQVWILLGAALFAIFSQGCTGNLNALLADASTVGNDRARIMGWQTMTTQIGNCGGYLFQFVLLLSVGTHDSWRPDLLGSCLVAGLALLILQVPTVFCLAAPNRQTSLSEPVGGAVQASADPGFLATAGQADVATPREQEDAVPLWAKRQLCGGRVKVQWVVVFLLEASFVLSLLCNGMSVKYFPLFFKQDFGFSPASLCALNIVSTVIIVLTIPILVRISRRLGRVVGILSWTCLGSIGTLLLAWITDVRFAVPVFLMRQAFMKSRDPMFQSILMDCLEKRHRGRFGAVVSIRSGMWAGSAWLGGVILDRHYSDYRLVFEVTALLMAIPLALTLPLLCLVPKNAAAPGILVPASGTAEVESTSPASAVSLQTVKHDHFEEGISDVSDLAENTQESSKRLAGRNGLDW